MFPEKGNMGKVLPEYLSNWTTEKVKKGPTLFHISLQRQKMFFVSHYIMMSCLFS